METGPPSPGAGWRTPRSKPQLISIALEAHAEVDKSITKLCNIAYVAQQPLRQPLHPKPVRLEVRGMRNKRASLWHILPAFFKLWKKDQG